MNWLLKIGLPSAIAGLGSALLLSQVLPGSDLVRVIGGAIGCGGVTFLGLLLWSYRIKGAAGGGTAPGTEVES